MKAADKSFFNKSPHASFVFCKKLQVRTYLILRMTLTESYSQNKAESNNVFIQRKEIDVCKVIAGSIVITLAG